MSLEVVAAIIFFENKILVTQRKFQTSCSTDFINLCKQHNINIKKVDISKCFNQCLKILKDEKIFDTYSDYITVGFENDTITRLITSLKDHGISYNFFLRRFYKEVWNFLDIELKLFLKLLVTSNNTIKILPLFCLIKFMSRLFSTTRNAFFLFGSKIKSLL